MNYPEHEKLKALNGKSQAVMEFLDWLDERGLTICHRPGLSDENKYQTIYVPSMTQAEALVAEFFDIDRHKLEIEKRAMLDEIRQGAADGKETP